MVIPINILSLLISFLLAVDMVTVFLASSIVGILNVVNAKGNESHICILADWNICGKCSCGLVSQPFLVAIQTRGAIS